MYRANQRYHKHRAFMRFMLIVVPILLVIGLLIYWFVIRASVSTSANFDRVGTITVNKPNVKDFTTPYYKISLPTSWEDKGRQNPFSYEVYYLYQNTTKDNDNKWLKVYVDVFPRDLPINRLLPITVVGGKISPGVLSEDCTTFTSAPSGATAQTKIAYPSKWQGVDFMCDMVKSQNVTGTASAEEGYAVTFTGPKSGTHKYFFTYSDFNVRPDYQFLTEALKSFEPL